MKKIITVILLTLSLFMLAGCNNTIENDVSETRIVKPVSKRDSIPFEDGQLYAVAYLGYVDEFEENLSFYRKNYLDDDNIPVFHIGGPEAYLIIPRYDNMTLNLYHRSFDNTDGTLIYENENCKPFVICCNTSDIFPSSKIYLSCSVGSDEFSPAISLADGSVVAGEKGLILPMKNNF